jgi:integrase/recombinase XerD
MDKMTILLNPTKKRTNLWVFFDDECAYVLRRWIKRRKTLNVNNSPALFLTKDLTRMSGIAVGEMFRKYARAAGFTSDRIEEKLTPHCARHWYTTALMNNRMMPEHVYFLRGDKGKTAASTYHHIDLEKVKEEYLLCIPRLGLI